MLADPPRRSPAGPLIARKYLKAATLALLIAIVVRGFAVQGFRIPSTSMLPTLQAGDHLLVNKLSYGIRSPFGARWLIRYRDPAPGEVIVFAHPLDPSKDLVKRVIATGGDRIELRGPRVVVNGTAREEPYAYIASVDVHGAEPTSVTVPPNQLFVMGDNRDSSHDSRTWGFVPLQAVKGRAVLICWSWEGREHWVRWERIGMPVH